MCGICGYFQFLPQRSEHEIYELIHSMTGQIVHRGPDAKGIFCRNNAGLGMRRLSIIDIETGNQPIFNEDESLAIVLNGEIYNFKTLRHELEKKGHQFTTQSDTEVVLHCYEEYGLGCLNKLEGMFVFAIYDLCNERLLLARDRFGEKPIFYYHDERYFVFGSELKCLSGTGLIKKEIDQKALMQYLQLTYIPAPLSIFRNVLKLMPATWMTIDQAGKSKSGKYWELECSPNNLIHDYDACRKQLREAVFDSVEQRMVSDVPIGTFLSGGIDSTIVTSVMATISKKPISTFTIGYREKSFDESKRAQIVADKYKTDHHMHVLDSDAALAELDHILENMDEPFADSSLIATYMVSKYARQSVKVILTGDCGDELFAGYSKYLIDYYAVMYRKVPKVLRKGIIEPIVSLLPVSSSIARKAGKVIKNVGHNVFEQRRQLMCLGFKRDEMERLILDGQHLEKSLDFVKPVYDKLFGICDEITQAQYVDLNIVLEGDMFPKVDRASMLASLETRAPLIDTVIVELAYRIPSEYKINRRKQKIILKDAFSDLIPDELLNAPKHGFGVPVGRWLRDEMREELFRLMDPIFLENQGIFNADYIRFIADEHINGRHNRSSELWTFFVFQRWYLRWM